MWALYLIVAMLLALAALACTFRYSLRFGYDPVRHFATRKGAAKYALDLPVSPSYAITVVDVFRPENSMVIAYAREEPSGRKIIGMGTFKEYAS